VLDNLVGNAVKYAGPDRDPLISVVVRSDGPHVLLEVADRGLGIPAEEIDHVFEPFRRAHGGGVSGSGLGLAICHSVVTRHGGTINARRRLGGGTVIALTLPRARAAG
jgi:signal transduction histidine kinase